MVSQGFSFINWKTAIASIFCIQNERKKIILFEDFIYLLYNFKGTRVHLGEREEKNLDSNPWSVPLIQGLDGLKYANQSVFGFANIKQQNDHNLIIIIEEHCL